MSSVVLSLDAVCKFYGDVSALDAVSLQVRAGHHVGLLGPNGAGKSTLFQIASGLFAPDAGSVEVFGTSFGRHRSAILRRMGVVFQSRSLDLDMTVRANLAFHGGLFGLSGRPLEERIDELSRTFGVAEQLDRIVRMLSGGQQRRVEIARALLNRPALLLMDEPSAGLDTTARRDLVALVRRLGPDEGVATLWATHLVDEVAAADLVVILVKGRVGAVGTPHAILSEAGADDLSDAYVALAGIDPRRDEEAG
jgi:ABC-2 type transport system ATP-binding protein